MKWLHKYHKQTRSKDVLKHYKTLNQTYKLGYDCKKEYDLLMLSVFDTGLKTKQQFEAGFETTRNHQFDMWENLSFNERNFLLKCDLAPMKSKLPSFTFEEETIYIPFFDKLMNGLYNRETAILELPQFFKLYNDFTTKMVPLDTYKDAVLTANMSDARYLARKEKTLILFNESLNMFYRVEDKQCETFPIRTDVSLEANDVMNLARALLNDDVIFIDILIDKEWLKPKCIKKIQKDRRKEEKKSRK